MRWQAGRIGKIALKEAGDHAPRPFRHRCDARMTIQAIAHEAFDLGNLSVERGTKSGNRPTRLADRIKTAEASAGQFAVDVGDEVGDHQIDHFDDGLITGDAGVGLVRKSGAGGAIEGERFELFNGEHSSLDAIVGVVGKVSDLIGQIDDLSFKTWIKYHVKFGSGGTAFEGGMFDDAFTDLITEIQAAEAGIADFHPIDRAEALGVVVKAAVGSHQSVEHTLTGMAERRMTEVVGEGDGLGEVAIEAEGLGDGASNLRRLESMSKTGAVVVTFMIDEYLGFVFEATERGAVNNTIAIALEAGAHRMRRLRHAAAASIARAHRVWSERTVFELFDVGAGPQHKVLVNLPRQTAWL